MFLPPFIDDTVTAGWTEQPSRRPSRRKTATSFGPYLSLNAPPQSGCICQKRYIFGLLHLTNKAVTKVKLFIQHTIYMVWYPRAEAVLDRNGRRLSSSNKRLNTNQDFVMLSIVIEDLQMNLRYLVLLGLTTSQSKHWNSVSLCFLCCVNVLLTAVWNSW